MSIGLGRMPVDATVSKSPMNRTAGASGRRVADCVPDLIHEMQRPGRAAAEADDVDLAVASLEVPLERVDRLVDALVKSGAHPPSEEPPDAAEAGADAGPVEAPAPVRPREPDDVGVLLVLGLVFLARAVEGVEPHGDASRLRARLPPLTAGCRARPWRPAAAPTLTEKICAGRRPVSMAAARWRPGR